MKKFLCVAALAVVSGAASASMGQIRITELMYNGADGEFIEIANIGNTPIDLTGWSYDDNSRLPGAFSLTAFGILAPGEAAIISELAEAEFRTNWSLPASVKVIGGNDQNLGRSDEVNIFDASNTLVDRLTYNDQGVGNVDGPRAQNISANTVVANLGANNYSLWFLSSVGDTFGSRVATFGDIGNPGIIPTPGALALLGMGGLMIARRRR